MVVVAAALPAHGVQDCLVEPAKLADRATTIVIATIESIGVREAAPVLLACRMWSIRITGDVDRSEPSGSMSKARRAVADVNRLAGPHVDLQLRGHDATGVGAPQDGRPVLGSLHDPTVWV